MKLMRWNNEPVMSDFITRFIENDFDTVFNRRCGNYPAANVTEKPDAFELELAAPGMKKDEFKISVENNVLTVSHEFEEKKEDENNNYTRREFCKTSFSRSFSLPRTVDSEKISATYDSGILKLNIPKKEEAKANLRREIEIS